MSTIWKLSFTGPSEPLYRAAERLDEVELSNLLSWSILDEDHESTGSLELLFDSAPDEDSVREATGLKEGYEARAIILPEEDWVALSQRGLPPVLAGRFALYGSHDEPPADTVAIEIEAGPAFGTGHHGTTKGCLIAFDALLEEGFNPESVLDLGTGTGALAIAAAKVLPKASILASDIDPDSTAETARNAHKNGTPEIEAITAEGFDHVKLVGAKFDLIFANILAEPLVLLAAEIVNALNPGGIAILSGLLVEQEEQVRKAYEDKGVTVEAREPLDGWATLVVRKTP